MDKRFIKQLIEASFTNNQLNPEKIEKIASLLQRKELKEYIRALKNAISQKTVYVDAAQVPTEKSKKLFSSLFEDKNIVYTIDPSLLVGIKIKNNDVIYEMNLKNRFDTIVQSIQQNYDR